MNLANVYACNWKVAPLPVTHGAILGKRIHVARLRSSGTILRSPLPAGATRETKGLTRLDKIEIAIRDAGRPLYARELAAMFTGVHPRRIRASLGVMVETGRLMHVTGEGSRYRYALPNWRGV